MPIEDICALPVSELVGRNAHLYLWVTASGLRGGLAVADAWGFTHKTTLTWCKEGCLGLGRETAVTDSADPIPERPRLLDLFCCSGLGAEGYQRAGFDVVGVDIEPQPNYPFEFVQMDALNFLARDEAWFRLNFDCIHASPPCQAWTDLQKQNKRLYPRLIEPTRDFLRSIGLPYIIENVEGAPLLDPIMLCGTMFPGLRVIRHRLFESSEPLTVPPHGVHPLVFTHDKRKAHYGRLNQDTSFVQVTGGGNCTMRNARLAMGLPDEDKRTKHELNEGIPPVYTEWIGRQLLPGVVAESWGRLEVTA